MKPAPFQYLAPESLEEALALMSQYGSEARPLAGGQSLIAAMNFRCLAPAVLIDLNRVRALDSIRSTPGEGLRIGAMTRYRTLEQDALIAEQAGLVRYVVPFIAHTAVRTRGTVGGSLAYADPAAELPTVTTALGARYRLASVQGERWMEAEEFFLDLFQTAIRPDELLVEVLIPAAGRNMYWSFSEVARRHGDRVMLGAAAVLQTGPEGRVETARLVYMNAGPTRMIGRRAADLLLGHQLEPEVIEEAANLAAREIDPPHDVHATSDYRRHLAVVLTRRVLLDIQRQIEERADVP